MKRLSQSLSIFKETFTQMAFTREVFLIVSDLTSLNTPPKVVQLSVMQEYNHMTTTI